MKCCYNINVIMACVLKNEYLARELFLSEYIFQYQLRFLVSMLLSAFLSGIPILTLLSTTEQLKNIELEEERNFDNFDTFVNIFTV